MKEVFGFAKHHHHGHLTVGEHDGCAHHCVNYALGGCKEPHNDTCSDCGKLHRFGHNMARFHQEWSNELAKAYEDSLPSFKKSSRSAAATEDTVPNYIGRHVKKVFEGLGTYFGKVPSP